MSHQCATAAVSSGWTGGGGGEPAVGVGRLTSNDGDSSMSIAFGEVTVTLVSALVVFTPWESMTTLLRLPKSVIDSGPLALTRPSNSTSEAGGVAVPGGNRRRARIRTSLTVSPPD